MKGIEAEKRVEVACRKGQGLGCGQSDRHRRVRRDSVEHLGGYIRDYDFGRQGARNSKTEVARSAPEVEKCPSRRNVGP